MPKPKFIVVFVTTGSQNEAEKIATTLVEEKLIGCANIIPKVTSIYRWEGKVEKDAEALMIIKTRQSLLGKLVKRVKELHSYDVPEVIAMPIDDGNEDYLSWLESVTC